MRWLQWCGQMLQLAGWLHHSIEEASAGVHLEVVLNRLVQCRDCAGICDKDISNGELIISRLSKLLAKYLWVP